MKKRRNPITAFLGSLLLVAGAGSWAVADFQTAKAVAITMEAVVGGAVPQILKGFQISHTPLQGISQVTKIAIIEGSVGTNLPVVQSKGLKASGTDVIVSSVTLRFRFVQAGQTDGVVHESTYPPFNADTGSFKFVIDPTLIVPGLFEYQIIARKFDNKVLVATASIPADAYGNPNIWITVGGAAGAPTVIGPEGGRVSIPDGDPEDGQSALDIPAGTLNSPTPVSLTEVPLDDPQAPRSSTLPPPLALYKIDSEPPYTGAARLSLLFPEFQPSASGWTLSGTPLNQQILTLGVWDGFAWRPVRGTVDANNHLMTARVGYAPYVGIFLAGATGPQSIAPVQKIITPNGDLHNDEADFFGIGPTTNVNIFDVNGHQVRTLAAPNNVAWDGRDDSGKIVESGVYIYQFSEGGQRVSGVIAVAK